MRRIIGGIALALGVALVVLAFAARPLVYDKLATVPLDQRPSVPPAGKSADLCNQPKPDDNPCYSSRSFGRDMQVLRVWGSDAEGAHYDKLSGVTVTSTRTVWGIPGALPEAEDSPVALWQTGVHSEAYQADGTTLIGDLTSSNETVTFDRRTGLTTGHDDDMRTTGDDLDNPEKSTHVEHEGLFFKFPFDVQKQTYKFWDGDLGKAVDIKFVREETLFGAGTYVFEHVIPQTEVTTRDVPAGVFDRTGDTVSAKVMYGNTRTLWVEPNTGIIIKGQEVQDKSLVSEFGTVVTTKGTIGYEEATVRENAETWGSKGRLLGFIGGPLMPLGLVIGGLAILAGLALLLLKPAANAEATNGGVKDLEQLTRRERRANA